VKEEKRMPQILLIDEDSRMRHLLGAVCYKVDVDIWQAHNSDEAVELGKQYPPQVIIVNTHDSTLSANIDLVHKLKHTETLHHVPIIMLLEANVDFGAAEEAEANVYFTKPIRSQALADTINLMLQTSV
jgi:CheY-like chemotaxis protein